MYKWKANFNHVLNNITRNIKLDRNIIKCIFKTSPFNIDEIPSMQNDVKQYNAIFSVQVKYT